MRLPVPASVSNTVCAFLAICLILVCSLCKCAKLREAGFIGLAEAELLDKGVRTQLSETKNKRTEKSRKEGTGGKARGQVSLLPGESQETGVSRRL